MGSALSLLVAGAGALYLRVWVPRADNVVLITVDTLRADRLSSYGYRASSTPMIDRIATEGARFAVAYCDIPWTTGSMSSVMTGTYGPRHAVQFTWSRLAQERLTLAEVLRSKGYATGAVVASFPLDSAYGLDQGFDTYDDTFDTPFIGVSGQPVEIVDVVVRGDKSETDESVSRKMRNDAYRPDAEVTRVAIDWVRTQRDQRFFLWVHYFGPHEHIREGVEGSQRQRMIDEYDAGVHESDAAIGTLLEGLEGAGLMDRTLIVLHADHGQELGEHGIVGHGRNLYEEAARIPLAVRLPGEIRAGTVIGEIVRNVDIFPTVLDYLGIRVPADLDGRSLRPWLDGRSLPPAPAFMELAQSSPIVIQIPPVGEFLAPTKVRGIRDGRWKYLSTTLAPPCWRDAKKYSFGIFGINPIGAEGATRVPDEECEKYGREELYQVSGDAYVEEADQKNLHSARMDVVEGLAPLSEQIASRRGASERFELEDRQKEKLKSLGYLE